MIKLRSNQNGMILVSVFLIVGALMIIGISLAGYTMSQYTIANRKVSSTNASMVAEAGIEQSMLGLNENDNFSGYGSEQEFFNNQAQGRGTFTTSVQNAVDSNTKIITATGTVYKYNQSSNPLSTRKIKVTVVGTTSEGFSVFAGPGGLILGGSANITNADVFVNGTIALSGSAKIGTNSQPAIVNVANQACPAGSNPGPLYPAVCVGSQPVTASGSSRIFGTVCATGQTNGSFIQPGSGGQGLLLGCVTPPGTMPSYDRDAHIASMAISAPANSSTYACGGSTVKTWPANLRLNGDLTLGASCQLTISGNVYITGNLTLGGSLSMRIANSLGTTRPVIVVDGSVSIGGSASILANTAGTGAHIISFRSNAACNPNCSDITGTALKTTQSLTTVDIGGSGNLPGSILQAYWGRLDIDGSGNLGAATGQTVDMTGSGTVVFGTDLSSGERSWTITSYQQVFD